MSAPLLLWVQPHQATPQQQQQQQQQQKQASPARTDQQQQQQQQEQQQPAEGQSEGLQEPMDTESTPQPFELGSPETSTDGGAASAPASAAAAAAEAAAGRDAGSGGQGHAAGPAPLLTCQDFSLMMIVDQFNKHEVQVSVGGTPWP